MDGNVSQTLARLQQQMDEMQKKFQLADAQFDAMEIQLTATYFLLLIVHCWSSANKFKPATGTQSYGQRTPRRSFSQRVSSRWARYGREPSSSMPKFTQCRSGQQPRMFSCFMRFWSSANKPVKQATGTQSYGRRTPSWSPHGLMIWNRCIQSGLARLSAAFP